MKEITKKDFLIEFKNQTLAKIVETEIDILTMEKSDPNEVVATNKEKTQSLTVSAYLPTIRKNLKDYELRLESILALIEKYNDR